jgi:Ca2+-binding RTX toxin-like protein
MAGLAGPATAAVIDGTAGPDTLVGTAKSDTIHGYGGADKIHGRAGDDLIYAGKDLTWDHVYGGRGNDRIHVSRDYAYGGRGNDLIFLPKKRGMYMTHIDCGPGYDQVYNYPGPMLASVKGCEKLHPLQTEG